MSIINNGFINDLNDVQLLELMKTILLKRLNTSHLIIKAALNPNVRKVKGIWEESDKSFLLSDYGYLNKYKTLPWIHLCGHHMGKSHHMYNSIESALHNAIYLAHKLEPDAKDVLKIHKNYKVTHLFWIILILFLIFKFRKRIIRPLK